MSKLDRKAFKGKFYEDIEKGIQKRYEAIYNKEIIVKYASDMGQYFFRVFIKGKTISTWKQCFGQEVESLLYIDRFLNTDAIALFASQYKLEDFDAEYNDYSKDNYKTLKEEVDKLVEEYTKVGIVFNRVEVDEFSYFVEVYHPLYSDKYKKSFGRGEEWKTDYTGHSFSIRPISTSTMKNAINDIKKMLKRFNGKCVQAALTGEKI